ncbi:MAG: HAMP domain-containing histidine kinase [Lachnospiraceae bacterium]|nr:HAMP domain-containing histidine kinase [Lachnospiraceae bacterium]
MQRVKSFFKSLRFFIFLMVLLFGIIPILVLWLVPGKPVWIAIVLIIAIVVVAFFVSRLMTKPLNRLSRSINDVQGGFEDDFEPVDVYTETGRISDSCDAMLQRLQVLDKSQQEFVSNVSHELKTPLTSMKVLADAIVVQEDAPIELYREFMVDIGAEIDRENEIIDDLLSLVKMDRNAADLNLMSVDVGDMLENVRKEMTPIAQDRGVQLFLEIVRPVVAEIDEVKVSLAVTNLVENAVKYNHAGGWVRIMLDSDHQNFFITVTDNGIGIPEEAQEQIFERFYRADKSHSNEISGSGLGLSLARNAVILHRGSIKVKSMPEAGSEFVIRIPLSYSPA